MKIDSINNLINTYTEPLPLNKEPIQESVNKVEKKQSVDINSTYDPKNENNKPIGSQINIEI